MTEDILGYSVFSEKPNACVKTVFRALNSTDKKLWLACLNPHSYAVAAKDMHFADALRSADWLIPDGIGVVFGSLLLGGKIRSRITGFDVFTGLHSLLETAGGFSVYFIGSTADTLAVIRARMAKDYPNVRVAGAYSPPFKDTYSPSELDDMIAAVNAAAPDVLWVGMTAPKQEKWISEHLPRLNVRFAGAVGAVFDFYARKVPRSPEVFQRLGLEWLLRLLRQPRRLWKRTFISAPIFLNDIARARLRK